MGVCDTVMSTRRCVLKCTDKESGLKAQKEQAGIDFIMQLLNSIV